MVEAAVLFLFATFFGYLFSDYVIMKKAKRWHHIGIKKGYHIHHSMWGVAALALTPMTLSNIFETVALVGFGIGIIIEHTISDSFVFINKINKGLEDNGLTFMNGQEE